MHINLYTHQTKCWIWLMQYKCLPFPLTVKLYFIPSLIIWRLCYNICVIIKYMNNQTHYHSPASSRETSAWTNTSLERSDRPVTSDGFSVMVSTCRTKDLKSKLRICLTRSYFCALLSKIIWITTAVFATNQRLTTGVPGVVGWKPYLLFLYTLSASLKWIQCLDNTPVCTFGKLKIPLSPLRLTFTFEQRLLKQRDISLSLGWFVTLIWKNCVIRFQLKRQVGYEIASIWTVNI